MISKKLLEKLYLFQKDLDLIEMSKIFGDIAGTHLWRKYLDDGMNILTFYSNLDTTNKRKFAKAFK